MSDHDAIRDLTHRYADAVCRCDADAWGATWAPDGVWDMGGGRVVEGRDAVVQTWTAAMGGFHAVMHFITNGTATLGGDSGTGRWYVNEYLALPDGGRTSFYAYYDDEYVRIGGNWLFGRRTLVPLYAGPTDLSAPFLLATPDG
ncbi:MAG: nuclear transport factor 2 family protein [Acidimicrobiia bacterium]|nr:nuclear transport factor 2 family protein [Acidimicrobiia bacterium]